MHTDEYVMNFGTIDLYVREIFCELRGITDMHTHVHAHVHARTHKHTPPPHVL